MGKFRQCLTELSAHDMIIAGYYSLMFLFVPYKRLLFLWGAKWGKYSILCFFSRAERPFDSKFGKKYQDNLTQNWYEVFG